MIWITRAQEDAKTMAQVLLLEGFACTCFPLLEVSLREADFSPFLSSPPFGLVATSRNGLKGAVASGLPDQWLKLPLFVVGRSSQALAKELGFLDIRVPHKLEEGARGLVSLICQEEICGQSLLHIRGCKVAFDLKNALKEHDICLKEAVTYQINECQMLSDDISELLKAGVIDRVVLMSPRTAQIYGRLMKKANLIGAMQTIEHVCLSKDVVKAVTGELAEFAPQKINVADMPSQEAIMKLLVSS